MVRCAFSRTATVILGWVIGILGQRKGMPRWANDLMWKLDKCHKSMERRFRWRDVVMMARCGEMEFNLDG